MRAKEQTYERVAQYLRLYSCLFQTTLEYSRSGAVSTSSFIVEFGLYCVCVCLLSRCLWFNLGQLRRGGKETFISFSSFVPLDFFFSCRFLFFSLGISFFPRIFFNPKIDYDIPMSLMNNQMFYKFNSIVYLVLFRT